jgi:4-hydroxy-4-methyl-2-oxoglutarate aldolase
MGHDLDWLTSTLASDASGGEGALDGPQPIKLGQRAVGEASTLTVAEGDNLELREAVRRGPDPGPILVIGGSPGSRKAVLGDLFASWIQARGFRAVILDGRVRDVAALRAMELQIWCRGVTPIASAKVGGGRVGGEIDCGGVRVAPGDLVVADDDGVVVWPAARVAELLKRANERLERDQERAARVAAGGELD